MPNHYDIAIIGAGIAGASLAAFLENGAPNSNRRVALLEAEDTPGYHTTGRSAAFWDESYGGPLVQPLTTASGPWLRHPPAEFGGESFLKERGSLTIARAEEADALAQMAADFAGSGVRLRHLDEAALRAAAPMLSHDYTAALAEPDCADIDVARLHAAFLKVARQKGAELLPRHRVTGIRHDGKWHIEASAGGLTADLIVNAGGAWASDVAAMAGVPVIPISPLRRTVVQIAVEPAALADAPLIIALDGSFYVKPEGNGRLWLSPHDETPDVARDCAAEEIDVAVAIDRLERATHWRVTKVERAWAGLRNFAPDRLPVIGALAAAPTFFWFAGQGGWGIQTAPAAAMIAAALLQGRAVPAEVAGVDVAPYMAGRFG